MKATIFFLTILLMCVPVAAAGTSLSPEGVVRAAVAAAHLDDRVLLARCCDAAAIAAQPRHSMSGESMISLFKKINEAELKFEASATNPDSERVTIRLISPSRMDFDLSKVEKINGGFWRIVAIHP